MRRVTGTLLLLLLGCASGRAYKTDRFEVKIADATKVEETRGAKGPAWKFSDPQGRQFLGASTYPIAGDPTVPCGVPEVRINGAPAIVVKRTLGNFRSQSQPVIASTLFAQEDGTVLDFTYEETNEAARAIVSNLAIRHPRTDPPKPCEAMRSGGPLAGDTYDAGSFTAKLLPGTWLLDFGHFRPADLQSGPWYFEDAATGRTFLAASVRSTSASCLPGAPVPINGAIGFRVSDTDNLEPYPGSSNVTLTFLKKPANGGTFALSFFYDEHAGAAPLAEKTLQSVHVRDPAPVDPACGGARNR
ncbi:MAG: hypothetical protein ACJ78W_09010 [Myxococcales bacterium]